MRIRSIKYKSSTHQLIDDTHPQSRDTHSRVHIINSDFSDSHPTININRTNFQRQLFTECHLNHEPQNTKQPDLLDENQSQLKINGAFHRVAIKSQKIASKASSAHQSGKNLAEKENRTSIFQRKDKGLIKLDTLSLHQKKTPKKDKIRFRLSKFSQHTPSNQQTKTCPQSNLPGSEFCSKDQIILGDNLTYNCQCIEVDININQTQLQQITEQTRKQHSKIQKIRKDLSLLGAKIERQLQRITVEFRKGVDNINNSMSKAKTQKCTILANWRGVISQKAREYKEERDMMERVGQYAESVKNSVEGNELSCMVIDMDDIEGVE